MKCEHTKVSSTINRSSRLSTLTKTFLAITLASTPLWMWRLVIWLSSHPNHIGNIEVAQ